MLVLAQQQNVAQPGEQPNEDTNREPAAPQRAPGCTLVPLHPGQQHSPSGAHGAGLGGPQPPPHVCALWPLPHVTARTNVHSNRTIRASSGAAACAVEALVARATAEALSRVPLSQTAGRNPYSRGCVAIARSPRPTCAGGQFNYSSMGIDQSPLL